MQSKFAKLFERDGTGQILVVKTATDDGYPTVEVSFKLEQLGVATFNFTWDNEEQDVDERYDNRNNMFNDIDEFFIDEHIVPAINDFLNMLSEEEEENS